MTLLYNEFITARQTEICATSMNGKTNPASV